MITRLAALGLLLAASAASAQDLPCSPLRLVVPYPAGGATDVAARLIAERLEPALKKTVVIENRAGATGNIGTVVVVQSAPDGCTLLVNAASIATFTVSFSRPGYDALKDLVPVGGIGVTPTMLVTATANPPNDLKALIEWGKSKPDGLTLSSAGYGLIQHLAAEEIGRRSGVKLTHILYRGGAPAMTDLVTGRVDLGSFAAGTMLPLIKERQLKAVAVIAPKRSALIPDVPTTDEQGLIGINSNVQFMVLAPAATPKLVIDHLSAELRKVVGDPTLTARFAAIGFEPTPSSSEEMAAIMRKTAEDWIPVIRQLNIKMD
jgi:tripartite-type tricarboxylate transporter receptor subunit TctC